MSKKLKLLLLFFCMCSSIAFANNKTDDPYKYDEKFKYPFYLGFSGGYGATTWNGLVPEIGKASPALALSTPTSVTEGGWTWGAVAGFELIPQFAVEASYFHYPRATIHFDKRSLFSFQHHSATEFTSNTQSVSLMGKFMVIIPHTTIRAFSSVGAAGVRRNDILRDCWRGSPAFGVGLNYNITPRLMTELGINYIGGYGESELTPASDYVPFLYSVFLRLAFRF